MDGLELDDLQRIELEKPDKPTRESIKAIVETRGGGRILAKDVTISDDHCQIAWNEVSFAIPLDSITVIHFSPDETNPDFAKAAAAPPADRDVVFIKDDMGIPAAVKGTIDRLTPERLTIEIEGQQREIDRDKLFGAILAQVGAAERPSRCLIYFQDGSVLPGTSLTLAEGRASLSLNAENKVEFAWSSVARVAIRSSRMSFLSDLKPLSEEHQPIVTWPLRAQRDRSVSGSALTIGNQTFEKGLGVHARTELTFAAGKNWDKLVAKIGLDGAMGQKGDCVFIVEADGQTIFSRRMKGPDPPYELKLPITGCEQVKLIVEAGEGLDLADHANWCEVRFIKDRRP
jgi:hypothetical protein